MIKQQIIPGTEVIYWKVFSNEVKMFPIRTRIITKPWQLARNIWVCGVEGVTGGVSISNLLPVNDQNLKEAYQKGLPKPDKQ